MDLIGTIIAKKYIKAKELLSNGANPNAVDDWMQITPLHYAVLKKAPKFILELLITAGANITTKTADGHTPLDLAVIFNRQPAIKLLNHYIKSGTTTHSLLSKTNFSIH